MKIIKKINNDKNTILIYKKKTNIMLIKFLIPKIWSFTKRKF